MRIQNLMEIQCWSVWALRPEAKDEIGWILDWKGARWPGNQEAVTANLRTVFSQGNIFEGYQPAFLIQQGIFTAATRSPPWLRLMDSAKVLAEFFNWWLECKKTPKIFPKRKHINQEWISIRMSTVDLEDDSHSPWFKKDVNFLFQRLSISQAFQARSSSVLVASQVVTEVAGMSNLSRDCGVAFWIWESHRILIDLI